MDSNEILRSLLAFDREAALRHDEAVRAKDDMERNIARAEERIKLECEDAVAAALRRAAKESEDAARAEREWLAQETEKRLAEMAERFAASREAYTDKLFAMATGAGDV